MFEKNLVPFTMAEELSEDEKRLLAAFRELGTQPKADTKEDLQRWMADYTASQQASTTSNPDSSKTPVPQWVPHAPRLSVFSGNANRKDAEADFELWHYEVRCLQQQGNKESVIWDAVRRSLRGEAAHIAMRLGHSATLDELLSKLKSVFGRVQGSEAIMTELYNATQRPDEDVAAWGCRLEELVSRAMEAGRFSAKEKDETLRSRFWHGLRQELRDRTGHKYDAATDFDTLRQVIRRFEVDHQLEKPKPSLAPSKVAKSAQVKAETTGDDDLRAQVKQLSAQIDTLAKQLQQQQQQQTATAAHSSPVQNAGRGHNVGRGQDQRHARQDVVCYRCGEKGHIRLGCRVRLDHVRKPNQGLNGNGSAPWGRQ